MDVEEKIPRSLIILLVILGAAFSVLCGYAFFRFFVNNDKQGLEDIPNEQREYMRDVRRRNKGINYFEARAGRHERRYAETPIE